MSNQNPHPLDGKRIEDHDRAIELGSKGGSARTAKQQWRNQKYCTDKCVFFDRCPAITTSMAMPEAKQVNNKKYHLCFIKSAPSEIQNLFKNLFDDGEEGLVKDILSVLFQLRMETMPKQGGKRPTAKDLKQVIDSACLVKRTIYGDKTKTELSGEITGEFRHIQVPELRKLIQDQITDEC